MSERFEVQRTIPADASAIFDVVRSPRGHVAIDASGMLQSSSGEPAGAVGDTFVIHMDREALGDMPMGKYDVTVTITGYEQDRFITWEVSGTNFPSIGHYYGYRLEPVDGGTLVTSIYDWSGVDEKWKPPGTWPIISELALKATLGILERTVRADVVAVDTWHEPAREVPIIGRPDVLVVGAGSAGVAAAVAAARGGADTWLIEQSSALGGLATVGLINLLLTLDDGAGEQVVAGLCQEFVDRMQVAGRCTSPPRDEWNREEAELVATWRGWGLVWGAPESVRYSVAFDPDAFVDVAIAMLGETRARLRLHTSFAGVAMQDGTITAVLVESKKGREAICPRVVIDATGDGDVFAAAGAPYEQVAIPPHLWFRVGGVDGGARQVVFDTVDPGRVLVPWGPHPDRVDPCDPDDLTRALLACRAGAAAAFEDLRASDPAFAHAWLDDYARMLGITESRRLVGDHVLTKDEGDLRFADAIARTGHWTKRGVVYEIPFRCLTTPAADNLLVAGRCISATRYVHQATKEIPAAMATGEAAGTAAAIAAAGAANVRGINVDDVRRALRARGADLGAE